MTLHTAKGLEYDAVFLTGVEKTCCRTGCPRTSRAGRPRNAGSSTSASPAKKSLFLSLAMTRAQFGDVNVAMPSRFLQEIPEGLIDWKQSPAWRTAAAAPSPAR